MGGSLLGVPHELVILSYLWLIGCFLLDLTNKFGKKPSNLGACCNRGHKEPMKLSHDILLWPIIIIIIIIIIIPETLGWNEEISFISPAFTVWPVANCGLHEIKKNTFDSLWVLNMSFQFLLVRICLNMPCAQKQCKQSWQMKYILFGHSQVLYHQSTSLLQSLRVRMIKSILGLLLKCPILIPTNFTWVK